MAPQLERPAWIIQTADLLQKSGQRDQAASEYTRARQTAQEALVEMNRQRFQGTQLEESKARDLLKEVQAEAEKALGSK